MNNIKNIAASVVNDTSSGKVKYYFDGKEHPFVQLNASGAGNDPDAKIMLKGDIDKPVRELVGLFDASGGGASWSADGNWEISEPRYALDVLPLWNGAKELCKETVVSTGGYESKYAESPEIRKQASKVFFPSMGEYEANPVVAGTVYSACGNAVWSRSAWYVGDSTGGMYYSYGVSNALAGAPAFNLNLEKVLIARSATSGMYALCTCEPIEFEDYCDGVDKDIKFLAMTDDIKVMVEASHRTGMCIGFKYMTKAENDHTYLSSVITDRKGRILYYNVLKRIPVEDSDVSTIGGILLPNDLPKGYKVGIFREVRNDAYYTDTCSEIVWLDV